MGVEKRHAGSGSPRTLPCLTMGKTGHLGAVKTTLTRLIDEIDAWLDPNPNSQARWWATIERSPPTCINKGDVVRLRTSSSAPIGFEAKKTPAMRSFLVLLLLLATATTFAQTREKGPYTLYPIIPGVIRIEDANQSNPAGPARRAEMEQKGHVLPLTFIA